MGSRIPRRPTRASPRNAAGSRTLRPEPDRPRDADASPAARSSVLRPKAAASLIILDRSGAEPKVLMGKRHVSHVFLPDRYVFPGGRLEPGDRRMPVATALPEAVAGRILRDGTALALAAVRETYEETGFCLGVRVDDATRRAVPPAWKAYAANGVLPDLAGLHLVARAVTPVGPVRRFDAHFFCADATAIVHRTADVVHADSELVDLVWVTLPAARDLPIPRITHIILDVLTERLAGGLSHAAPVPFFTWRHGRSHRFAL